ncbi:MAG TPA: alpha/beta fold hydrolase [Thermoanaerobaculia bacterium]|nr:alpha/beta fold hydrolase [Thermoanaerobaculia bacterium]
MHLLSNGPADSKDIVVLAHGAGGAMDTPFLNAIAAGAGERGIRVVRFEFPYMAARREGGRRGPPDREPVLLDAWRSVIDQLGGGPQVVIGGKSLGGRMASLIADEVAARGLICLGYPFHPPGKPERVRTKHLASLQTPTLIVQGERDPFGGRDDVAGYTLSPKIRIEWIRDGDHSFRPRAHSGATEEGNLSAAISLVCGFVAGLD